MLNSRTEGLGSTGCAFQKLPVLSGGEDIGTGERMRADKQGVQSQETDGATHRACPGFTILLALSVCVSVCVLTTITFKIQSCSVTTGSL